MQMDGEFHRRLTAAAFVAFVGASMLGVPPDPGFGLCPRDRGELLT